MSLLMQNLSEGLFALPAVRGKCLRCGMLAAFVCIHPGGALDVQHIMALDGSNNFKSDMLATCLYGQDRSTSPRRGLCDPAPAFL